MAFNVTDTISAISSAFKAHGGFTGGVQVGEPDGPVDELTVAIWMASSAVVETTLVDTVELYVFLARMYLAELNTEAEGKPQEAELGRLAASIFEDLMGDFDLQSTIRNIDIGAQYGVSMGIETGHVELGSKMYRVADMTIPMIVDGSATFSA